MVPDINCKGDVSPSVQVPLKVVPERVGASLVAVMLMVAVAVVDRLVPIWPLSFTVSVRMLEVEGVSLFAVNLRDAPEDPRRTALI